MTLITNMAYDLTSKDQEKRYSAYKLWPHMVQPRRDEKLVSSPYKGERGERGKKSRCP